MSGAEGPPPSDEVPPRRIAVEIFVYALLVVAVGAAFVALRVRRVGTRVLDHDPHGPGAAVDDVDVR